MVFVCIYGGRDGPLLFHFAGNMLAVFIYFGGRVPSFSICSEYACCLRLLLGAPAGEEGSVAPCSFCGESK